MPDLQRCLLTVLLFALPLAAQTPKVKLWSLQPVTKPAVTAQTASKNPIDAFVEAELKAKGLRPNPRADKLTLLRRVSFDVTGLPPTPAEQEAFLADAKPDAYVRLVDRLLQNEQHGVRWARHWLDVLRYSDMDGIDGGVMPSASGIFRWRDWMIHALNEDMPYDQFVSAQLLGNRFGGKPQLSVFGTRDRPESNPVDQFALGFLARNALQAGDRTQDLAMGAVETISSAFMGMTVGCAKCHDHRFDPIKQSDYYAMKALFDPLVVQSVSLASPQEIYAHGTAMTAYHRAKAPIDAAIAALTEPFHRKLYEERVSMLPPDVRDILRKPEAQRTIAEQKLADDYYPVLRIDPPKIKEIMPKELVAKYDALLKQQSAIRRPDSLPNHWVVNEDSVRKQQTSYILTSGDPMRPEKDKPVKPGFPFQPEGTDFRDGLREGFTAWLTAKENPLFARVAVNRLWQWHFGEGLQKNPSDFGLLGGRPSHPKLLDYLASEFVANNFSMRWLHRLILTSDAYQRSSLPSAENLKTDPANTYLWRFRLQRMEAEPLWDAIQMSAGDLDLTIGGRSFQLVKPDKKQSIFLPSEATFNKQTNRRGAYILRGFSPSTELMAHFLQSFDVDDGRTPCPVRTQTVTAPQALFTLNDPVVDQAAAKLAYRLNKEATLPAAARRAFREVLNRPPTSLELDRALSLLAGDRTKLKDLAWMLYNLDEFLFVK